MFFCVKFLNSEVWTENLSGFGNRSLKDITGKNFRLCCSLVAMKIPNQFVCAGLYVQRNSETAGRPHLYRDVNPQNNDLWHLPGNVSTVVFGMLMNKANWSRRKYMPPSAERAWKNDLQIWVFFFFWFENVCLVGIWNQPLIFMNCSW